MNWNSLKSVLNEAMSSYFGRKTFKMRQGKYTSGDHFRDGYVSMLYETIHELNQTDSFDPLGKVKVRSLIYAFNRLTGEKVPDVWIN